MSLIIMLAVATVIGIVGMLLANGAWDYVFFALTVLPVAIGLGSWWRLRKPQVRER